MGFKSLIEKQVQGAMRILGTDADGLARGRDYYSANGRDTYDYDTRRTTTATETYPAVPMALVRFQLDDMDEDVQPTTDRRALVAALDLPVAPGDKDYIIDELGIRWNVRRILSDPADSLHILHLRKVG